MAILENTRGLGKQYHNLYAFNHLFSLNYEVKKVLYKGAVLRVKSENTKLIISTFVVLHTPAR